MSKKNTSFRLDEVQLIQLAKLVDYYKHKGIDGYPIRVSRATVVESLIRDRFNELASKGEIEQ